MNAEPSPETMPRHRTRRIRAGIVIGGVILLAGLLLFPPQSASSRHLETIRKLGYPTSLKDLNVRQRPANDAENINVEVSEAVSQLRAIRGRDPGALARRLREVPRGEPLPHDLGIEVHEYLEGNRVALESIPEIVRRRDGWTRYDYSGGYPRPMHSLKGLLDLSRALELKAGWDAEEQRSREALEATRAIFGIAHGCDTEPFLFLQALRFLIDSSACWSINRLLNRVEISEADLLQLQQLTAARGDLRTLRAGMAGEFCSGLDLFDRGPDQLVAVLGPQGGGALGASGYAAAARLYAVLGLLRKDRARFIELFADYCRIYELEPWNRYEAADAWLQRAARKDSDPFKGRLISGMAWSSVHSVSGQEVRCTALLRCTATGLALERFRRTHNGAYPDSLQALVPGFMPAVPIDPFDGRPLRYVRRATGYVVYSIGADRADNGGTIPVAGGPGDGPDITFVVER